MDKGGDKKKHALQNKKATANKQELGASYITEAGVVVEKLTQIWQEILEIETISVNDNFFELGGHSILAMKGMVRIKEKFEIEMAFKDFMNFPTITLQSEFIKTHLGNQKDTIRETKGKARIKDKFEIEMASKDSMHPQTISTQAELIKVPIRNLKGSGLLNDISHSANIERFPLTETQKTLWYLCLLNINSPAYNLPFTLKFTGELNREILHKTIEYIFKRHNITFATFHSDDGEPHLSINQNQSIEIKEYDLERIPENELKRKYNEIIGTDSRLAFNLEKGPLFRLHLLKINRSEWLFHITIHHLVFDGISWGIFLKEFNSVYKSLVNDEEIKLEDIKFHQYHYAKWLKKNPLQQNSHSVEFWRKYLDGIPAFTNFPLDRSRKKPPSGKGAKTNIKISSEIAKKIIVLSQRRNTTVFTTMLSAFSLLIKRFNGENDLCIGSPIASRPNKFLENIFGCLVDTLPMRFNFEGINTFEDLLNYTKSIIFNVLENKNIGYEKIVEIVNPERNTLYNPIYQIAFVWPKELSASIKTGDLRGERFIIGECVAPFDITFYMWEFNGEIEGEIEYNIDLFDETTINSIRESYIQLLSSVVKNTKENINNLRAVNDNQFNILKEFNNTKVPYPQEGVSSILKQICNKIPGKTALNCHGQKVSYSELEIRSNQLALELIRNGIKGGEPVGIFMDKSNELIISIVAILKINCYYLPLDPEYPLQRTLETIHDAACRYIITSEIQKSTLTGSFKTITIDDSIWQNKSTSLSYFSSPEDFAYIMYTSGTTGIPKGSIIKHKGILRLVRNTNYIHLEESDNILLTGAIGFDASTFEIWGALLNGCTLFIIDTDVLLDPYKLEKEIIKNNITVLWLTSSLFTQIVELNPNVFANLRYLLAGGDVLSIEQVNKIRNLFPSLIIINGYGPTENTTFSTCHIIHKNYQDNIPIGKPINNSTAYIFNDYLQLQPIGAFGELYVGGDGLSHGYLNRPKLNAEKFINNPLNPCEKLFKTGDKARWLPDGNIEFHGRIDDQLKIRGYRIEPIEIESKLCLIEGIKEAVVKVQQYSGNDKRLVAFLLTEKDFISDEKEIISVLKKQLPSYMIPSYIQFQKDFPRTLNGKTDRKKLKYNQEMAGQDAPDFDRHQLNTIELNLYELISDLIKHKKFNIDDSFFDIGGNSLLSVKLISRIEKEYNVLIPVRDFLAKYNTVRQIGKLIKQEKAKKFDFNFEHSEINKNFNYLYRLQSFGNEIPIFSFYCEKLFTNIEGFSRSIYDFTWPGSDGRPFNFKSIGELAETYLVEMKKVNPDGPYYLIGFSFGGLIAYEIAQRLIRSGYHVPILFLIDVINPQIWTTVKLAPKYERAIKKHGFVKAFTKHLFHAVKHQSKEQIKRIKILIYFKLGKKLPPNLIQTNIVIEANKLMMNYNPQFYHGEVHLFKSEINTISDPYLGWKSLVNKINWFSITSHHIEAVIEKNNKIKILSELKNTIRRIDINHN